MKFENDPISTANTPRGACYFKYSRWGAYLLIENRLGNRTAVDMTDILTVAKFDKQLISAGAFFYEGDKEQFKRLVEWFFSEPAKMEAREKQENIFKHQESPYSRHLEQLEEFKNQRGEKR